MDKLSVGQTQYATTVEVCTLLNNFAPQGVRHVELCASKSLICYSTTDASIGMNHDFLKVMQKHSRDVKNKRFKFSEDRTNALRGNSVDYRSFITY